MLFSCALVHYDCNAGFSGFIWSIWSYSSGMLTHNWDNNIPEPVKHAWESYDNPIVGDVILKEVSKINPHLTITEHNKISTVCVLLLVYCCTNCIPCNVTQQCHINLIIKLSINNTYHMEATHAVFFHVFTPYWSSHPWCYHLSTHLNIAWST